MSIVDDMGTRKEHPMVATLIPERLAEVDYTAIGIAKAGRRTWRLVARSAMPHFAP